VSNYNKISSLIWNICDDVLRGVFKPHEYGDVILPFIVLQRLDCVLEPHKDDMFNIYEEYKSKVDDPTPIILNKINKTFFNHSKYDLNRLKSDPQNIDINFENYLDGYSDNVVDIIENFQLEKPVQKLKKNNRLYQLIDKFTSIDLHPNTISNHEMGTIYEELIRKFSELSNESSGDHYTPKDIVQLLVSLVFEGDKEELQGLGKIRSIFDSCCGTGGMLTVSKQTIQNSINPNLSINLYGQELNPTTYSVCKSDFLILGEDPENIKGPKSSLTDDQFEDKKFDYMIVNPPFGESWSSEKEDIIKESKNPNGRYSIGLPWLKDGSFLFLQNLIKKMEKKSKIGIIFGGSTCFTGKPDSGESKNREYLLSNDMVECIVRLPKKLFFNTPLTTYLWIITNNKKMERKGFVQLIDSKDKFFRMNRPIGQKFNVISEEDRQSIIEKYVSLTEDEYSRFIPNDEFGFQEIEVKSDKEKFLTRIPLNIDSEKYFIENKNQFPKNTVLQKNKIKVGYEVIFNRFFYEYTQPENFQFYKKRLNTIDKIVKEKKKDLLNV
jgi:type I restriction enzyme M protein